MRSFYGSKLRWTKNLSIRKVEKIIYIKGIAATILLGIAKRTGVILLRMQEVKISETGILELDIMELPINRILIISESKVKLAELPPHAGIKIITNKGKVARLRCEEGEDF